MSNPYRPMSKTKRFFKRIEKFFVTCKQKFIVHYLITHGGKEIIEHYSNSTQQQAQVPIMPNLLFGHVGGKAKNVCQTL